MGRVERQTIQVAIESVHDLHMHACLCVALPPAMCIVAQASCAVGGVITVTITIVVLHHTRLYTSSILVTKEIKAVGINLHLAHRRLLICYESFYSRSGLQYLCLNLPALF